MLLVTGQPALPNVCVVFCFLINLNDHQSSVHDDKNALENPLCQPVFYLFFEPLTKCFINLFEIYYEITKL